MGLIKSWGVTSNGNTLVTGAPDVLSAIDQFLAKLDPNYPRKEVTIHRGQLYLAIHCPPVDEFTYGLTAYVVSECE